MNKKSTHIEFAVQQKNCCAIVLCGGKGNRLWPLSRENKPKQFINNLYDNNSLFQDCILRLKKLNECRNIIIVANQTNVLLIKQQLEDIKVNSGVYIIIEETIRNTMPALIYANHFAKSLGYNYFISFPSDHIVKNEDKFLNTIRKGLSNMQAENILIIGDDCNVEEAINKEFGKIFIDKQNTDSSVESFEVKKFVEKNPNTNMLKCSSYINCGIVFGNIDYVFAETNRIDCDYFNNLKADFEQSKIVNGNILVANASTDYKSIDHFLLENCNNLRMIKCGFDWIDLGSWNNIIQLETHQTSSNIVIENANNCYIKNNHAGKHIVVANVADIAVYCDNDLTIVTKKTHLKDVQSVLQNSNNPLSSKILTLENCEYRKWGHFEILFNSDNYKIKKLTIRPKESTSLQTHNHRSEYWIVSEGKANIILEEKTIELSKSKTISIPINAKHKISNDSENEDLVIIEVQFGEILEESDITRYPE